ncbi:methyltransferase domain-containing protein [Paraburkholderia sp. BR10954]|uniref:methyltransferase domain-containing protein n=1 Tax=Paraburkholderia sp. BR10954 TaxID=3236995 RepID=UPI0034D3121F
MKFDYVIASHVIEHVLDLVGWVHSLLAALKHAGRIVLAVPDRRYTFDYVRPFDDDWGSVAGLF